MHIRRIGITIGLIAIAAVRVGIPATAQARRPMTLINLAEIPRIQDPQLSPDGRTVSYQLARAPTMAVRESPRRVRWVA